MLGLASLETTSERLWTVQGRGGSVFCFDEGHSRTCSYDFNPVHIAQYIIEHGGNVNAIDNNKQTALQWAAVRGSIAVADVLLLNGARVEATDIHGYWAVHVAARYGQTAFLNHIVAKYHADYDAPDKDGRCPLHWYWSMCSRPSELYALYTPVFGKAFVITPVQLAYVKGHQQITIFLWALSVVRVMLGVSDSMWSVTLLLSTFLILDAVVLIAATTLTTVQASQIARNITTNELSNAICYGYLHGPDGQFMNPYNHGCQKNCTDFLIRGYRDDEVARPPLQRVAS
ncbi:hypothetical protein QQP08_008935 [Theobroma cacao]|nr:hypothetical protein QQP08_008935 [Theobroma cacao]